MGDDVMAPKKKKDAKLTRAGVSGYNKPKRTPNHPKKSHVVVAKVGSIIQVEYPRRVFSCLE